MGIWLRMEEDQWAMWRVDGGWMTRMRELAGPLKFCPSVSGRIQRMLLHWGSSPCHQIKQDLGSLPFWGSLELAPWTPHQMGSGDAVTLQGLNPSPSPPDWESNRERLQYLDSLHTCNLFHCSICVSTWEPEPQSRGGAWSLTFETRFVEKRIPFLQEICAFLPVWLHVSQGEGPTLLINLQLSPVPHVIWHLSKPCPLSS